MKKFGNNLKEKIRIFPHVIINLKVDKKLVNKKLLELKSKFSGKYVISFLGFIRENKGIKKIIKAWETFEELNQNSEILLVISGKNIANIGFSSLKKFKNVYLNIGELSNEEFQAYLKVSDIILLPYEDISQSRILMSAIYYEKPIIGNDVGGISEINKIAKIGEVIENINSKEIKEAILKLKEINHDFFKDPLELRKIYSEVDLLIGMRLHSIILATSVGIPAIGIFDSGWGKKNPGSMKKFELPFILNLPTSEIVKNNG